MAAASTTPLAVAALVLPSVVPFDLCLPVQVFGYPRPDLGAVRYRLTVCGARPGAVPTSGGFAVAVEHGLEALAGAHTVGCEAAGRASHHEKPVPLSPS